MIEWVSVSKAFGENRALSALTLAVDSGEVFGFLGPNGAGKTTAIKIAVGLLRADAGEVRLGGVPASDPRSRHGVGFLPEEIRFPAGFRLGEWVRYQLDLRGGDPERIVPAAEGVGLRDRLQSETAGLSKGMKRRAGLLLLSALRPRLWLLDEPTADLDVEGREIFENILLAAKGDGATIFLSSHILSEVERVCDRVGIVERGSLTRTATPAELLPAPFLVDLTFASPPEGIEPLLQGMEAIVTPEAKRVRVFVQGREEGDRVIRRLEEEGHAPLQSIFRPASLRDSIRKLAS